MRTFISAPCRNQRFLARLLELMMQRCRQSEIMDDPSLNAEQHVHALHGLERINRWSASVHALWSPIQALAGEEPKRTFRVLDIATGAGDVPIQLWHRAHRAGVRLIINGCDRSPVAIAYARQRATQKRADVTFFELDALNDEIPPGYDAVTCSLFLHHLHDEEAVRLLRSMAQAAGWLVVISDLVRSRTGLSLAHLGTRLLSTSAVVHVDGPRSVRAAYTVDEARVLATRAGMDHAKVWPRWPCRYLLVWKRP